MWIFLKNKVQIWLGGMTIPSLLLQPPKTSNHKKAQTPPTRPRQLLHPRAAHPAIGIRGRHHRIGRVRRGGRRRQLLHDRARVRVAVEETIDDAVGGGGDGLEVAGFEGGGVGGGEGGFGGGDAVEVLRGRGEGAGLCGVYMGGEMGGV